MTHKVTVTTANRPASGPNSRVRMGENVLAVVREPEIVTTANVESTANVTANIIQ